MIVCGASFAGLAVARELAGSGRVLLLDRYEIGERQTSACAAPTAWLEALGLEALDPPDLRQARHAHPPLDGALPAAVDLLDVRLPAALRACSTTRTTPTSRPPRSRGAAPASGERDRGPHRPRRPCPRRWSWTRSGGGGSWARSGYQPPDAPLSRGLEVHPARLERRARDLGRPRDRPGRLRMELPGPRRGARRRRLVRPPLPRQGPDGRPRPAGCSATPSATRATGSRTACAPRPRADVFFAGDSAGHCLPLTAEGIRTAFYFGIALGRELRQVRRGARHARDRAAPLRRLLRRARVEVPLDAARAARACRACRRGCSRWPSRAMATRALHALGVRPLPRGSRRPSFVTAPPRTARAGAAACACRLSPIFGFRAPRRAS